MDVKGTHMDVKGVLERVDCVLLSNSFEKEYLFHKINLYYQNIKKREERPASVIQCDFKKKEIIAFWEYLKEDDFSEGL